MDEGAVSSKTADKLKYGDVVFLDDMETFKVISNTTRQSGDRQIAMTHTSSGRADTRVFHANHSLDLMFAP